MLRKVKGKSKIDDAMSGHSKWSKVKHQKSVTDAVKGKLFTKMANAIIIAIKAGGGITDPASNFKLRLAIEKAKSVNMPKENIVRAIERAKGEGEEENINEVLYEAFGPKGVGILIKTVTTNKQRAVSEIKNILEKLGGVLVTTGAVSHLFNHVGLIELPKNGKTYEDIFELSMEAGAIDLDEKDNYFLVYTLAADLHKISEYLTARGLNITNVDLYFRPTSWITLAQTEDREKIGRLLASLEELEDVHKVYANYTLS